MPVSLPTKNSRPTFFTTRRLLLGTLLAASAIQVQARAPEWLEPARAACAEEFADARCDDHHFLQQQYAPETIAATREVARRAAIRKNGVEQRALREVMLRYTGLCEQNPEQYCQPNSSATCIAQLRQSCATIKQRAALCEVQTKSYCAQQRSSNKCLEAMKNQCADDDQSIDQILARYPELSPNQKAKLKQTATELEKTSDKSLFGSLASTFLNLLGFAL